MSPGRLDKDCENTVHHSSLVFGAGKGLMELRLHIYYANDTLWLIVTSTFRLKFYFRKYALYDYVHNKI